jgi:helicase
MKYLSELIKYSSRQIGQRKKQSEEKPMDETIEKFLKLKKFEKLNEIQEKAVKEGILERKGNFVVIAPTGSGKTGIAELAILKELDNKCKVIYAVPSHALINDKLIDFAYLADSFKISEGGRRYGQWKKNDLVVTTFELVYRACLLFKGFLDDFGLVVVDEFHVLYDNMRGYNLEKLMTILKQSIKRTVCISATFEDKQEIGAWLEAKVIVSDFRPVPLVQDIIDLKDVFSNIKLCQKLIEKSNAPCLVFCRNKRFTKDRAIEMCKHLSKTKNDEKEIVEQVKKAMSREEIPELERTTCSCLAKGIGFYHSDLHKNVRNFEAKLFKERRIDYLFCTTGLAYGINFPARSVVISDMTLWDAEERRSAPIHQQLYDQMAGRAGRIGYDTTGYSYLVVRKDEDLVRFEEYKKGVLPMAKSKIGYDEYFRKAILEIIYSGRNTDKDIIDFFESSLFNFQATRQEGGLISYDLPSLIKTRIQFLHEAGFLERLGTTYQLTDFGRITLDYLFSVFSSPKLSSFVMLNQYLDKNKSISVDFNLVHFLSKSFPNCIISKQEYKKSEEVEHFLQSQGISEHTNAEYSAYVVYYKWIENVDEVDIDDRCKVYSSNLPSKMWEISRILSVYEQLALARGWKIPPEFPVFKERIYFGVREDELPLRKIHGIGRETVRSLRAYCYNVLQKNLGYKGTPLEILVSLLEKQGEKKFLETHVKYISHIGEAKAKRILSFVKEKSGKS